MNKNVKTRPFPPKRNTFYSFRTTTEGKLKTEAVHSTVNFAILIQTLEDDRNFWPNAQIGYSLQSGLYAGIYGTVRTEVAC